MGKLKLLTLGLFLLIGCTDVPVQPHKYMVFDNDWQRDNLLGKVKEVTQYKANLNSKGEPSESPIPTFKTAFTGFGKVSKKEYYDDKGNIQMKLGSEYNDKEQQISNFSENNIGQKTVKSHIYYEFDKDGNQIFAKFNFNDTLKASVSTSYDSLKHPVRLCIIQNKDTTVNTVDYKYNKERKILWKKETFNTKQKRQEQISEFRYNAVGNLLEVTNSGSTIGVLKTVHTYNTNNKIIKSSQYKNGKPDQVTEFDDRYNPISIQYFTNDSPFRELKYTYQFDRKGNWIERDMQVKEQIANNAKFQLQKRETRTILYY